MAVPLQAIVPNHKFIRKPEMNYIGLYTLVKKETGRFLNVYLQTIFAPVTSTLLFFCVFALAFGGAERQMEQAGISYLEFLAPGLVMMTMAQNAFANSSSSIIIGKIQGNIVDLLVPPLSSLEIFIGYIAGACLRGLLIGVCAIIILSAFVSLEVKDWLLVTGFSILGTMLLASIGVAAGLWAEKFDHIAAVTNFIVTPLTFLSGTFYSIYQLPDIWEGLAYYNPFFYMIDGFRSSFIGYAETDPVTGLVFLFVCNAFLMLFALILLRTGYKIKS